MGDKIFIDYIDNIINRIDNDIKKITSRYDNSYNASDSLIEKYYGLKEVEELLRPVILKCKKDYLKEKEKLKYDMEIKKIDLLQ